MKQINKILHGDCIDKLKELGDNSVDCLITDPPYGYSFMGKDWDKAVPSVEIWKECLRVLKPGGFAFVMSAPRQDVLSHMIYRLGDAGFRTDFTSLYWTYASGFPKAINIGKMVDKRGGFDGMTKKRNDELLFVRYLKENRRDISIEEIDKFLGLDKGVAHFFAESDSNRAIPTREHYRKLKELLNLDNRFDKWFDGRYELYEAEREILSTKKQSVGGNGIYGDYKNKVDITSPATDQAKALDGSYGGFQPKPAVEVIIVCMKPLSEKTYVDQALKNGKGVTWLDDCRIGEGTGEKTTVQYPDIRNNNYSQGNESYSSKPTVEYQVESKGRFPANLLVSDDVLNDGVERKSTGGKSNKKIGADNVYDFGGGNIYKSGEHFNDAGSYSRYFNLDKWANTLPFLITPKASKSEKNRGLEEFEEKEIAGKGNGIRRKCESCGTDTLIGCDCEGRTFSNPKKLNHHPTVKPLKLMSYLITLGSREGDLILDPFAGSGTTLVAAKELKRNYIGIEREEEYVKIINARLSSFPKTLFN